MDGADGTRERGVGAEVELVVEGDEEAEGEGAGCAGEGGGVELVIDCVNEASGEGGVEEASEPFAGSGVGFGWDGFA